MKLIFRDRKCRILWNLLLNVLNRLNLFLFIYQVYLPGIFLETNETVFLEISFSLEVPSFPTLLWDINFLLHSKNCYLVFYVMFPAGKVYISSSCLLIKISPSFADFRLLMVFRNFKRICGKMNHNGKIMRTKRIQMKLIFALIFIAPIYHFSNNYWYSVAFNRRNYLSLCIISYVKYWAVSLLNRRHLIWHQHLPIQHVANRCSSFYHRIMIQ